MLHLITPNDTQTHTHNLSLSTLVGLLWNRDQPVAETST